MEKLTPELQAAIAEAVTLQAVEDLYRPFRPKRKTRATVARAGLEPLAKRLAEDASEDGNPLVWAEDFVDRSAVLLLPKPHWPGPWIFWQSHHR